MADQVEKEACKEEPPESKSKEGQPVIEDKADAKKNDKKETQPDTKRKSKKQKWNGGRKKSKKPKTNYTWREDEETGEDSKPAAASNARNRGNSRKDVHPGSYANPAMREMFNVTLEPHLLPPDIESESPPTAVEDNNSQDNNKEPRNFSKKKVAFLLGYIGKGFAGFQSNEGQRTLQAEFELALVKSELLSNQNFGYFHKYSWSTSGRTDKGVHACAQVCSAKIQITTDQTLDDIRELINSHLPQQFRVLDVVRTGRSFCAKTQRSRVRYQYMIPAFCFWDRQKLRDLMLEVAPLDSEGRRAGSPLTDDECQQIKSRIKDYRVDEDQLKSLQDCLKQYEGTHSFHNFTKGMTSKDPSATRYILSFHVEDPIVFDNGIQWVPTQVVGQSFLLHQIRKMVSVALDSVRMKSPLILIPSALDKNSKTISDLAPAQGLFLEMSYYDAYNKKIASQTDLDKLDWTLEDTPIFERWKTFRNDVLMQHVVKEEDEESNFIQYLYNHEFYFDMDECYELKSK